MDDDLQNYMINTTSSVEVIYDELPNGWGASVLYIAMRLKDNTNLIETAMPTEAKINKKLRRFLEYPVQIIPQEFRPILELTILGFRYGRIHEMCPKRTKEEINKNFTFPLIWRTLTPFLYASYLIDSFSTQIKRSVHRWGHKFPYKMLFARRM